MVQAVCQARVVQALAQDALPQHDGKRWLAATKRTDHAVTQLGQEQWENSHIFSLFPMIFLF